MSTLQHFLLNNTTSVSLVVYISLFMMILYLQPSFIFDTDGSVKPFGLGSMDKTVLPLWLVALGIAICSYMAIMYYLAYGYRQY